MLTLLVTFVCLLVLDLPMIMYFNNDMYKQHYERINGTGWLYGHPLIALCVYIVLAFSIYFFVLSETTYINVFIRGCILGFCIYAIFNGTNKFTIEKYGWKESIIDTLWGTILFGCVSVSSLYISSKIKEKV